MTIVDLAAIIPWVLPVFLGAVIGYLTNSVAIRMLFRPIRPLYVLGLRIPFTPGVIPRQREELARSIGRMVSRDLLTDDVFYRRFSDPGFRVGIQRGISRGLARLQKMPLGLLVQLTGVEQMVKYASRWFLQALSGDGGTQIREQIARWVSDGVQAHAEEISSVLVDLLENTRPLAPVTAEDLAGVVEQNWAIIVEQIEGILQRADVQRELHQRVQRIIRYSLDQLTSMQRLLVTAAQYDRQIESRIPVIVDRIVAEVIASVQDRDNRARILEMIVHWIGENRERTVASLVNRETRDRMRSVIVRYLGDREQVRRDLDRQIDRIARSLHGDEKEDQLSRFVSFWISRHADTRVGTLLPVIGRRRSVLSRFMAVRIQRILSDLTRLFLEQLDIYSIVVDRINSLDVERVEGLLMGIIRRHLRWINVFGAILGSLIGAAQIVLRLLGVV